MRRNRKAGRRSAFHLLTAVGAALLGAGCSRPPVAPQPTAVYVSPEKLVTSHPQWPTVIALDRQIRWLSAYSPSLHRSALSGAVPVPGPPPTAVAFDVAALERRITERLDADYRREHVDLEKRLEEARAAQRAPEQQTQRLQIEDEAEKRFQAVFDRHNLTMRNLMVKAVTIESLERFYLARGWNRDKLAAQHADVVAQMDAVRSQASAEVGAVFDWMTATLNEKQAGEDKLTQDWLREHQKDLDTLNREMMRQKNSLIQAFQNVGAPVEPMVSSVSSTEPSLASAGIVTSPLPSPRLAPDVAELRRRRAALAQFILKNTKAIVKSAALRQGEYPFFERTTQALPDRTEDFRSAVRNAPVVLRNEP